MASKYWMKLHYDILEDPNVARLPDRLFRRTIECNLLAGDYEKSEELPTLDRMAWRLHCDPNELEQELIELEKRNILYRNNNKWCVTGFDDSQKALSDKERAKIYYDNHRLDGNT